jgi:GNAT superfamily N-acetyltransferase
VSRSDPVAVRVRAASAADAIRLAELSGQLGYPIPGDTMTRRLGRLVGRQDNVVLVAELLPDGRVVGWVHGAAQDLLESGQRCEILGLVVDEDCRGRGIGRRLVSAVEAWAASRGLESMTVRSNVARTGSHPFYERLGYVRTKTQHAYRKPCREPPA